MIPLLSIIFLKCRNSVSTTKMQQIQSIYKKLSILRVYHKLDLGREYNEYIYN